MVILTIGVAMLRYVGKSQEIILAVRVFIIPEVKFAFKQQNNASKERDGSKKA